MLQDTFSVLLQFTVMLLLVKTILELKVFYYQVSDFDCTYFGPTVLLSKEFNTSIHFCCIL